VIFARLVSAGGFRPLLDQRHEILTFLRERAECGCRITSNGRLLVAEDSGH
jgi:hypothetical protein